MTAVAVIVPGHAQVVSLTLDTGFPNSTKGMLQQVDIG